MITKLAVPSLLLIMEDAVVVTLETATKYPEPVLYSTNGCQFYTRKGNVAVINVNGIPFADKSVIAEAGRYSLNLVIFNSLGNDAPQLYGN